MQKRSIGLTFAIIAVVIGAVLFCVGCMADAAVNNAAETPKPAATPAKNLTTADVAKLKWIEGMWRGLDGDKPFYERYRLENASILIVETLTDGDPNRVKDVSRFELKDGVFGKTEGERGSAATFISGDAVQFVAVPPGKGNAFRFERKSDDKWNAVLEWNDKDGKPQQKVYQMEKWPAR
ncbi:MAG: hypothetical protein ACRD6X_13605 [Pyrinomonadaceae bacterium]